MGAARVGGGVWPPRPTGAGQGGAVRAGTPTKTVLGGQAQNFLLTTREKSDTLMPLTGDEERGGSELREEMPAGWHRYGR